MNKIFLINLVPIFYAFGYQAEEKAEEGGTVSMRSLSKKIGILGLNCSDKCLSIRGAFRDITFTFFKKVGSGKMEDDYVNCCTKGIYFERCDRCFMTKDVNKSKDNRYDSVIDGASEMAIFKDKAPGSEGDLATGGDKEEREEVCDKFDM